MKAEVIEALLEIGKISEELRLLETKLFKLLEGKCDCGGDYTDKKILEK